MTGIDNGMDILYVGADNEITGTVTNKQTGAPINNATVSFILRNLDLSTVSGGSGSMAYVAASQGIYTGILASTVGLIAGRNYLLDITAVASVGTLPVRRTCYAEMHP